MLDGNKRGYPRAKGPSQGRDAGQNIALAFVGCFVPDEPRFHNDAFSRAGQIYQEELLLGLKSAGLSPSVILSVIPIPSFPKVGRFWVRGGKARLSDGLPIKLLPFLNITPLKQLTIGLAVLFGLISWAWRTRSATSRVVYAYNLSVPPGLFILLGARLIGAKAVVSLCDINVPGETVPSGWSWRLDFWLQRWLIPHFDGYVVASDAIARDFLRGRPHMRLDGGIARGILEHYEAAESEKKSADADGRFVITAAGSLREANGLLVILKAFSALQGEKYRLCIAGPGPLENQIRAAAERDPRIQYLGMLSFEEVLRLYDASDVLINMRLTRTLNTRYFFPSKLIEYLAAGKPVITTCTGHAEAEYANFAFLLREETPEALTDMIERVAALSTEERQSIGLLAQQYMFTQKTWRAQAQRVAEFIRSAVLGTGLEVTPGD
jgi:glycosyltransferase involved in cell wall biosynthesis